ncbi:hypothetical protein DY000_02028458 [Brassica cretica]|uniref:Uncharacterized protein n=1 Tax=Brassica cretica TaxID=69181 RepID=A0ABQ7DBJ8_BRACR|nr:hypothetical protein DY000_02028458 [Brassica cretica]
MGRLKSLVILALLFSLSFAVFADSSKDASTHGTDVAVAGFLDGATTVVVVHKPRRPWKLKLLRPTLLNLSRGVVVAVDMDVADPGVMDGAATVVAVHKPRKPWKPKLLMPTLLNLSKGAVVAVDTDVAESAVMDGAATVVAVHKPRPWKPKLLMPTFPQTETVETEAVDANVVEPQQGGRGGCRYGCCGSWRYGRCSYCCRGAQAESEGQKKEEAKP